VWKYAWGTSYTWWCQPSRRRNHFVDVGERFNRWSRRCWRRRRPGYREWRWDRDDCRSCCVGQRLPYDQCVQRRCCIVTLSAAASTLPSSNTLAVRWRVLNRDFLLPMGSVLGCSGQPLTVTLLDNVPARGSRRTVRLERADAGPGTLTVTPPTAVTDANGVATFDVSLTHTAALDVVVRAVDVTESPDDTVGLPSAR